MEASHFGMPDKALHPWQAKAQGSKLARILWR